MYSDVINIARKFTSMVEDQRKQELMRKTARQSLDFDSPPRKPAKYRHQQFTPPRHARELIKASKCYVALSVKEFSDKYVLLQAGEHTMSSHERSSGILNPKQKGAVERAARSAPLALGTQIHTSMQKFQSRPAYPLRQAQQESR
jgi:hypothetical protein